MFGHPPTERKVKASTSGASVGAILGTTLAWYVGQYLLPKDMDPVLKGQVVVAIPTIVTAVLAFASGWLAKHTPRTPVAPVTAAPAAK